MSTDISPTAMAVARALTGQVKTARRLALEATGAIDIDSAVAELLDLGMIEHLAAEDADDGETLLRLTRRGQTLVSPDPGRAAAARAEVERLRALEHEPAMRPGIPCTPHSVAGRPPNQDLSLLLADLDRERATTVELCDRLGWAIERVHEATGDALERGLIETGNGRAWRLTDAGRDRLHPWAAPGRERRPTEDAMRAAARRVADGLNGPADRAPEVRDYAIALLALAAADERIADAEGYPTVPSDVLAGWLERLDVLAAAYAGDDVAHVDNAVAGIAGVADEIRHEIEVGR